MSRTALAIDPGRAKCGVAVVKGPIPVHVLHKGVVETSNLPKAVTKLLGQFPQISLLLMGDGTGSTALRLQLEDLFPELQRESIDEHGTSELARARYLAQNPPTGLRRLLPPGLRAPESAYDDYVAVILAEKYFSK